MVVTIIIIIKTGLQLLPSQREELPVREEVVEDDAGVISSVIVPTLEPVAEDAMEESSVGSPDNL